MESGERLGAHWPATSRRSQGAGADPGGAAPEPFRMSQLLCTKNPSAYPWSTLPTLKEKTVISHRSKAILVSYAVLIRAVVLSAVMAFFSLATFGQVVTATLPGGTRPAVNPVTNKIYYLSSNNLVVVDGATNSTTTVPVGVSPFGIAVNPVTNKIYVVNAGDNTVTIVDGATNSTTTIAVGNLPFAAAVDPVLNQIYVANGRGSLTVINGATNATTDVPLTNEPQDVAVNRATHNVYVAHCDGDGSGTDSHVSIVDGNTLGVSVITIAGRECNDKVA